MALYPFQKTIKRKVECTGVGLHSGNKVKIIFYPAPVDHGIKFKVILEGVEEVIEPSPYLVCDTLYATCLSGKEIKLKTVEHLLACLRGLGIDNIMVEVVGDEIPILDGSSASFVYLFKEAGIIDQPKYRKFFILKRPFFFKDKTKDRWIKAYPFKGFKIRYTVEYKHPFIGRQQLFYDHTEDNFIDEIAKARTFGFLSEIEKLKENELIKGGSLDNALVFDNNGVINKDGFRYKDEPVRHKILDFIGDLNLLQYPLLGFFDVYCSGHKLNNLFLRELYCKKERYLLTIDFSHKEYQNNIEWSQRPIYNI